MPKSSAWPEPELRTFAEILLEHLAQGDSAAEGFDDFADSPRTEVDIAPPDPDLDISWDLTDIEPTTIIDFDDLAVLRLMSQVRRSGERPCRHLPIEEDEEGDLQL